MKIKAVSGLVFYVKNITKTAAFYKTLGFIVEEEREDYLSIRLNWFWMDFHSQDSKEIPEFQREEDILKKGAGVFFYMSVEDVDEFYKGLLEKGIKSTSEPTDYPWGNREFMILDPDGYKLVFFKKSLRTKSS